jgi:hypothetical protein
MTKRSRRIWFAVTIIALIGVAVIANFMGDGIVVTLRELHGHP